MYTLPLLAFNKNDALCRISLCLTSFPMMFCNFILFYFWCFFDLVAHHIELPWLLQFHSAASLQYGEDSATSSVYHNSCVTSQFHTCLKKYSPTSQRHGFQKLSKKHTWPQLFVNSWFTWTLHIRIMYLKRVNSKNCNFQLCTFSKLFYKWFTLCKLSLFLTRLLSVALFS